MLSTNTKQVAINKREEAISNEGGFELLFNLEDN